jgi:hypothetical protein
LYTAQEVVEGVTIKEEDKNNMTDSGVDSIDRFDPDQDDKSDFDNVINRDKDMADENM